MNEIEKTKYAHKEGYVLSFHSIYTNTVSYYPIPNAKPAGFPPPYH